MADQVVQNIVDWINVVPPIGIYLIFFGIAYLENLIPPMPGDVIVAFGGYLAAEGTVSFMLLFVVTVFASVIGFMNMYWFGKKWGSQIEENPNSHLLLKFIDYKYFQKGKKWMNKWGQWVVFGNRFLAGTRSVISLTTGMSGLKVSYTVMNSFLSSILWNALLLGAGWYVQDNWEIIGRYLSNYGKLILGAIIVVIALKFLIFRSGKKDIGNAE
ncbi:MAG: DedA family protein [Balneola sp.]|nr:DedA family protein [Balneola sp.]MBO6652167.1 DedA family protein [Balneola sp.]MBO6712754.1 DedA family protein [Balneola sp.]MBO6801565.1 DedA family protein [Balneola sp.]MBO6871927.1 DedA family protein [Balneola sp.]